jgi:hypothetical protein
MRGTIYEIDGETLHLRDITIFNARSGGWERVSVINPTGSITTHPNTILVDRNEVIPANRLRVGQQILAFSNERRDEAQIEPNMSADAYIILVEN